MSTTAWRILQEEMRITPDEARVLTALLTGNPVALLGHEALVPLSSLLLEIPKGATSSIDQQRREDRVKKQRHDFFCFLQKMWTVESPDGLIRGFMFVTDFVLVDDSNFLRYRINQDVLRMLEAIKRAYDLEALF
ncbi:hypothetical protein [Ralstonia solanacearum]|uniref:hypothetical protein n=1 Tax=Ralstonia solanacearum TaxID=305 RepID=UPI0006DCC3FB|nr:hypothetical protein [Ralstonia solanacearum]